MKPAVLALLALTALSGCVTPVGPVEVTRFHVPDTARLGRGTIAVEPAPGMVTESPELRTFAAAVARELVRTGYTEQAAGRGDQIALIRLERRTYRPERGRGPVSVGVGGGAGTYGSGVGVGIGIDLSGPPPELVDTLLSVTVRERASGEALWEGRASFTVRSSSPLAGSALGAAKMAEALFAGFPGRSGETIEVR